jgi:hydrogenase maturation protease
MNGKVLIACVGNIFFGDDAVGVEVASALRRAPLPPNIDVEDFGIRGYDLARALVAGYRAVIVVDAMPRGRAPGTVFVLEPDLDQASEHGVFEPHALDPWAVIGMAKAFDEPLAPLIIVGCEPATVAFDEDGPQLSPAVRGAVDWLAATALRVAFSRLQEGSACTSSGSP